MTHQHTLDRLLTATETADVLGLKVSTIRRMIWERRIDVVRPTKGSVRIPESSIRRILEERFTPAQNQA